MIRKPYRKIGVKQKHNVAQRAIAAFGKDAQVAKAVEECGELIAAIAAYANGHVHKKTVRREMAHAHMMIVQLAYIFDYDECTEELERAVKDLEKRVRKHENKK